MPWPPHPGPVGCALSSAAASPSDNAAPTANAILLPFLMIESPLREVGNLRLPRRSIWCAAASVPITPRRCKRHVAFLYARVSGAEPVTVRYKSVPQGLGPRL